jgi:2-aminoethylphosphonate transport system ATP-binding protein
MPPVGTKQPAADHLLLPMTSLLDVDGAAVTTAPSTALVSAESGNSISFENVTVAYRGTVVLESFNLEVEPGEILALIGPSGSGKTTALRAVAGFVRPASGRVRIGGEDVTDVPPYARGLGMVVQNYALFPHMRVDENVAFGLRAQGAARQLVAERVRECLAIVGMVDYAHRFPRELSGGQQQRVAIARALAIRPRVLLLDEPLSALDAQIRRAMVEELARLHRDLPTLTVLYVTHDQSEALTLADRIAIMRDGRLSAFGPSRMLYRRPPNRFAAEFLGRANLVPVRLEAIDAATGMARARFGERLVVARSGPGLAVGDDCLLCVRPHDLHLTEEIGLANTLVGTVEAVLWQGETHSVTLEIHGVRLRLSSPPVGEPPQLGSSLNVHFATEGASLIPDEQGAHG